MSPEYAFSVDKLPVFTEIEAAAKKYGVNLPVDTLTLGWASGMMLEAALKQCGMPCSTGEAVGGAQHGQCRDRGHLSRCGEMDEGGSYAAGELHGLCLGSQIIVGQAHHRMVAR